MKRGIIIAIVLAILIAGGLFYFYNNNSNNNSNYEAQRTATENNTTQNSTSNDDTANKDAENQAAQERQAQAQAQAAQAATPTEAEEIASFSTKIYTKDSARQNNINITCSTLNNTDVANGATFSFCNTVGKATSSKGYKEADIYTDGKKTKGYGGGNCQISTTLYNAVLKVPSLTVTERHEHSNKVPYIQNGKDAAVAYGSYDLKFRNDSEYDVKIKAEANNSNVTIKLFSLKS